jgi:hypothetical protein
VSVDSSLITIKYFKKKFTYNIDDIKEIGIVKVKTDRHGEKPILYLCFSKEMGICKTIESKNKKMSKIDFGLEYIVNDKYFIITVVALERLKPFLNNYQNNVYISTDIKNYKNTLEMNGADYNYLASKVEHIK